MHSTAIYPNTRIKEKLISHRKTLTIIRQKIIFSTKEKQEFGKKNSEEKTFSLIVSTKQKLIFFFKVFHFYNRAAKNIEEITKQYKFPHLCNFFLFSFLKKKKSYIKPK